MELERETVRKQLSHEEFLQSLRLRVTLSFVRSTTDLHLSRAIELFNKTNQFNTTGDRYTLQQCQRLFSAGRELYVLHAEDRFTQYGLVGAAWVNQNCVDHLVLSCRVLGLGIEETVLAYLASRFEQEHETIILGQLRMSDANFACRQVYARNGFTQVKENPVLWSRSLTDRALPPPHVVLIESRETVVGASNASPEKL